MADEQNTQVEQPGDDFDAAFNEASGGQALPETTTPAEEVKPDEAAPQEPASAGNPDEGQPEGEGAADAPKSPVDEAAAGAATPEQPAEPQTPAAPAQAPAEQQPALDPKYLAQAILEAQAEVAKKNEQPAAAPEPKVYKSEDYLTDDDNRAIEKFKQDWPEEYGAIQRLNQAAAKAHIANALQEYSANLEKVLAPLFAKVQTAEVNTFESQVRSAVPDLDQVYAPTLEWVKTQPQFLQQAYTQALQNGSAQDVIAVLQTYKQASGTTGAAPATPASSAVQEPKPAPAKPKVNQAAVQALAAVPAARREKPQAGTDPNDFDGAFEEATKRLASNS